MTDTKRVWVEIEAPPEGWVPGCVWPAVGILSRSALPVLAVHHTPPGDEPLRRRMNAAHSILTGILIEHVDNWTPGTIDDVAEQIDALVNKMATSGISAEAQAVLDAAVKWADAYRDAGMHGDPYVAVVRAACEAIDAYRASLAPPDPLDEVRAYLNNILKHSRGEDDRADAMCALAALDRAKEPRS